MSTMHWTVRVFGVNENVLDWIEPEKLAEKAIEKYPEKENEIRDLLNENGSKERLTTYLTENVTLENYASNTPYGIVADVLIDKLKTYSGVTLESNSEEGTAVLGVPEFYPWDVPNALKNKTENEVRELINETLEEFGVHLKKNDISYYEMENWG